MALNQTLANVAANAAADAVTVLADGGYVKLYDGSQPATPDTAITTQAVLAELQFSTPAFGAAVAGVATANAITGEVNAPNSGTATWFRIFKADGSTALWDGSVGTSNANCILSRVAIVAGETVNVSSCTYAQKKTG